MHNAGHNRIAVYRGPSGQCSTYPVREGATVPATIVSASGEVRQLVALDCLAPQATPAAA